MTVSNNYAPVVTAANGTTTVFTGSWNALNATNLVVRLLNTSTGDYTPVSQGSGSDQYQVTSLTSTNFVITFNTAPVSGNNVVISRNTPLVQTIPYTTSRGFQGSIEEGSFDALTNMVQEISEEIGNSIQVSVGDTPTDLTLPIASLRANQYLGFDSGGNVITLAGVAGVGISTPMLPVVQAASTALALSLLGALFSPQGRLTLTSNTPVMTAEANAQTNIYYTPYRGNLIPIYNGTEFINYPFSQLTLNLNTTFHPTSKVFDVYASLQSGVPTLSAMYWGGNTARSGSAGGAGGSSNAQISQLDGIWINNAAISSNNSYNGSTSYAIPANEGTYLGTFYTTAAGQTQWNAKPNAAAGGTANIMGIWNAYNRVHVDSISRDSTTSWINNSTSWNEADLSAANRVSWVDGLGQTSVKASYSVLAAASANGDGAVIGVNMNSTTAAPHITSQVQFAVSSGANTMLVRDESFAPQIGFNYIQAMDATVGSGTSTFFSNMYQSLILQTEY